VFYLPGLGRLVFQAITQRDLIVVKGVVVILVMMVVVITFIMDVLAMWLDPRLGKGRGS
jgi:peptide/nickel transport system permease protein